MASIFCVGALVDGVPFDDPTFDWAHDRQHHAHACQLIETATLRLVDLGLPGGPLLAQVPMTVRLQLLAENFARLRRQNPDKAILGAWDEAELWRMGSPAAQ